MLVDVLKAIDKFDRSIKNSGRIAIMMLLLITLGHSKAHGANYVVTANANWSTCAQFTSAPTSSDAITINYGVTLTVDVNTAVCGTMTIGSGATNAGAALAFNSGEQLTIASGLTLTTGTGSKVATLNMTSGGTLIYEGTTTISITGASVFTKGTGTVQFTASNSLPTTIFTSFNNLHISGGTTTLKVTLTSVANLTIDNTATLALATFNITSLTGNLTNNGTITTSTGGISMSTTSNLINGNGTLNSSSTGCLTIAANETMVSTCIFNITGASTKGIVISSGTLTNNGRINPASTNTISGAGTLAGSGEIDVTTTGATAFSTQYSVTTKTLTNLSVVFAGSGASQTANSVLACRSITVNNSSGVAGLTSGSTVTDSLILTSGALTASTNLTMHLGSWIVRSGGSMTWTASANKYNVSYTGSGGITTGPELSSKTVIINSASTGAITLNASQTIDSLNLVSGTFAAGTNLTMTSGGSSAITASGGIMTGTPQSSNVYDVLYKGAGQLTSTELAGSGLRNVTANSSGAITLNSGVTMTGNLVLTGGTFSGNTFTINIAGNITGTASVFSAGTSTVNFNSSSVAQTCVGVNFYNLTLNNGTGGLTPSAAFSVSHTLTLTTGVLTAGTNLTMWSGSTISRSGGSMTGTIQGSKKYNVTYTGSSGISTGPELTSNTLILTCSLTSATVTLGTALTVDSLSITSGTLKAGQNNITISSNFSNTSSATAFAAGTAKVIFTGSSAVTVTGTFAIAFNSLQLSSGLTNTITFSNTNGISIADTLELAGGTTVTFANVTMASNSLIIRDGLHIRINDFRWLQPI